MEDSLGAHASTLGMLGDVGAANFTITSPWLGSSIEIQSNPEGQDIANRPLFQSQEKKRKYIR